MDIATVISTIKTRIDNQVTAIIDVWAVPDRALLPKQTRFPCVGVKDGGVVRSKFAASYLRETYTIYVYVYSDVISVDLEGNLISNGTDIPCLTLAESVRAALENYLLGDTEFFAANCLREGESFLLDWGDGRVNTAKELVFTYERQRSV